MSQATLLDIAKLNGNDVVVGLIEENLTSAPEIGIFPARTIRGTNYTTGIRTGFPSTGFRQANNGSTPSKSTFRQALVQAYIFGGVIQVDKAVGMAHEDGLAAFEMIESSGVVRSALIALGSQIWYGVTADANGFAGIKASVAYSTAATALVVNAAGSTATTASSCYAVKFGTQDVGLVVGQGGSIELPPFTDQQIAGTTSGTWLPGRVSSLCAWMGLQIGNVNCAGRIANLTEDSGKGLSDSLLAQLLARFPVGYAPDAFFCSRRSARQLQISRTVVLNSGPGSAKIAGNVEAVAPWPTSAFGIPLYVTDSILNTDAIES